MLAGTRTCETPISHIWLCLFFENASILNKIAVLGQPPGIRSGVIEKVRVFNKAKEHKFVVKID